MADSPSLPPLDACGFIRVPVDDGDPLWMTCEQCGKSDHFWIDDVIHCRCGAGYAFAVRPDGSQVPLDQLTAVPFREGPMSLASLEWDPKRIAALVIGLLVVLGILALLFLPGAQAGTKGFAPKKVAELSLDLDAGAALPDTLLPGRPVPFTVAVQNTKGKVRSTADGSLDPARNKVRLTGSGVEIDRVSGVLTPVGDGPWTLVMSYDRRPDLDQRFTWKADRAALLGPEPANVRSLVIHADAPDLDGWLLPGSQVPLRVEVQDDKGRTYTTDPYQPVAGAPLHVPWSRFEVRHNAMRWLPEESSLWAHNDRELISDDRYSALVAYKGAGLSEAVSWKADYARRDGPLPAEVTALRWELVDAQGQPVTEFVVPGAELRLQAQVDSTDGRTFRTDDSVLGLPMSRLQVDVRGGEWVEGSGVVRFAGGEEPIALVGRQLGVTVGYQDRNDLKRTVMLRPDMLAPLAGWLALQESQLRMQAPAGVHGAPGKAGAAGRNGTPGGPLPAASEAETVVPGEAGLPGGPGTDGADGGPGQAGPDVRIHAAEVSSLDGLERMVLFRIERNGAREYGLKRWADPPIKVVAGGGPGGNGGAGGVGGSGGAGGAGCIAGAGGPGGPGGNGGSGGAGGKGGAIKFVGHRTALQSHFVLDAPGGPGGLAGDAGAGGAGGPAGEAPGRIDNATGRMQVQAGCVAAAAGAAGAGGAAGQAGAAGARGEISREVDTEAWDHLHDMPAELSRYLLH